MGNCLRKCSFFSKKHNSLIEPIVNSGYIKCKLCHNNYTNRYEYDKHTNLCLYQSHDIYNIYGSY